MKHPQRFLIALGFVLVVLAMVTVSVGSVSSQSSAQGDETPSIVTGTWTGTATYGPEETPNTAEITFVIDGEGNITEGQLVFRFTFEGITPEMETVMEESGCVSEIAFEGARITGDFTSPTEASGEFSAPNCTLAGYDPLDFGEPVTGTWTATATGDDAWAEEEATDDDAASEGNAGGDGVTAIAAAPDVTPTPHPNDSMSARDLYKLHCEECHGPRGQGTEDGEPIDMVLEPAWIAETMRTGPETMDTFSVEDLSDVQVNAIVDFVLRFNRDNPERTEFIDTTQWQ
ncbi:MAG: cytochrome c [Chloroflexi bacterium]|nr:cytochrome c [Chloroflexota bacterium]